MASKADRQDGNHPMGIPVGRSFVGVVKLIVNTRRTSQLVVIGTRPSNALRLASFSLEQSDARNARWRPGRRADVVPELLDLLHSDTFHHLSPVIPELLVDQDTVGRTTGRLTAGSTRRNMRVVRLRSPLLSHRLPAQARLRTPRFHVRRSIQSAGVDHPSDVRLCATRSALTRARPDACRPG